MSILINLSVRKKLIAGFVSIELILMILSFTAYRSLNSFAEAEKWNTHTYKVIGLLDDIQKSLINMETGERGFLVTGAENYLEPYNQGKTDFEASFSEVKSLTADNPAQQENLGKIKSQVEELNAIYGDFINLRREVAKNRLTMDELITRMKEGKAKQTMDQIRELIANSKKMESTLLEERTQKADQLMKTTNGVLLFGCLIGLVLAGFISYFITKQITRGISAVLNGLDRAANGDLTAVVDVHSRDEIGNLAESFNRMVVQQREAMGRVLESSGQVNRASVEIAKGNQDLSQRTQEQASMLEEVAATVEQIAASIQMTAANSSQADQVSHTTLGIVSQGESAVEETITAMKEITVSSRQISEIIKVVNDIAFQTNLLALNAAVEAARAGEQGRGFAVVAAEVRNLAGRTAESSKEIEKLIKESVERVERGNTLVQQAGDILRQIVNNTKHTSDVVLEITSNIREQSTSSGQIRTAIQQLNQVTQQNAAMVQEIAATSESLNAESEKLNEMVSVFKLSDTMRRNNGTGSGIPKLQPRQLIQDKSYSTDFKADDLERF